METTPCVTAKYLHQHPQERVLGPGLFVNVRAKWNQVLFEEASKDARQPRAVRIALLTPPSSAGVEQRRTCYPMSEDKLCVCSFLSVYTGTHHPREVIVLIWVPSYRDKHWLLYRKDGAVYAGMAMGEFLLSSMRSASQQGLVAAW